VKRYTRRMNAPEPSILFRDLSLLCVPGTTLVAIFPTKSAQYIGSANEETLRRMRTVEPVTVSNRKVLAQAILHSGHHWAQVAMEVRHAGFPTEMAQDIIASPVMK